MLHFALAALLLQPPAAPTPESRVSRDRLMATLAALPTARAAKGTIAAQEGLAATEDLLIAKLKELGYDPQLEPLSWNLGKQVRQDELLKKQAFMEGIMEKKRPKQNQPPASPPKPDNPKPPDPEHQYVDPDMPPDVRAPAPGKPAEPPPATPPKSNPTPPKTAPLPETTPELAAKIWHNIIIEIRGTELPDEVLIVSAHFDAVPGAPGADDDGTGVAALLEAARVLKDHPMRRTVRLIFFNLEEVPLEGSKEHVKRYKLRLDAGLEKLVGMVSLEMLGYFSDMPDSQRSPIPRIEGVFDPPTVADFIGIATLKKYSPFARAWAAAMTGSPPGSPPLRGGSEGGPTLRGGSPLKVVVADMLPIAPPDFLRSDHAYFLAAGQPALMLTDTANFRNPNYHKPTDTVDTIDAERFTLVTRGVVAAIRTLADAPNAKEPAPVSTEPRP